jgi:class 3 adenylate cyclase
MGKLRTHGVADWDPSGHPTRWTRRWGANKLQRTASPEAHCFPWLKCRPQRRLAAILAADVVRYSRLMEVDEAGTLAALKARRKEVLEPLVAKHQGRVFKVTGNGVLVEFASAVNASPTMSERRRGELRYAEG